jgi:hypothetical protein
MSPAPKCPSQRSYTIILILNVISYLFSTVKLAILWYSNWAAFIEHGDTSAETLMQLLATAVPNAPVSEVGTIMTALQVVISDGIMVCVVMLSSRSEKSLTRVLSDSYYPLGLEVLGYMEP